MRSGYRIDGLQYANWSERIFREMRDGGVHAVHVTIAYHESFREMVLNIEQWNRWFEQCPDLIFLGHTGEDVRRAFDDNRTAIFFGLQNPSPIEDDLSLIEICHTLGVRFMQLSYNNQSLFASGCYEHDDAGITRFGRQAIAEMNRVGMAIDMSHSGERSTLEAIEFSSRPIAVTHSNPSWWHPVPRNKSDAVIKALTQSGGMLGVSIYPHHLKDGSQCTLSSFSEMLAECAERYGVEHLAIGSDLCQDQPDRVLTWMRHGRWAKVMDYGDGPNLTPGFPDQPEWFRDNRDFRRVAIGLESVGFSVDEIDAIIGGNWLRFFDNSFHPETK